MRNGYVISVDPKRCVGCRSCEIICSLSHVGECNPERSRVKVLRREEDEVIDCVPVLCLNCELPECEKACPTGATRRGGPAGVMLVEERLCIGCSSCVFACPHGASVLDCQTGKAMRCDNCQGEPRCVGVCTTGCLQYISVEKLSIRQKRANNKVLADILTPPSYT